MHAPPLPVRTLDNGLTVVIDRHPVLPRVAARLVFRWGASDDPAGASGMAHLVEHLLANKGSARLGVTNRAAEVPLLDRVAALHARRAAGEDVHDALEAAEAAAAALAVPNALKRAWASLGGTNLNASTSHDRTEYRVELPAERLGAWARLEADRFGAPVFRTFGTELGTVLQEIARSGDDANRATWAVCRAALWGGHPYGRPVLGSTADVAGATPARAMGFVDAGYGMANAVAVLVGDVDVDAALRALEGTLGRLPAGSAPPRPLPPLPPLVGEHRVSLAHAAEPEVRVLWRTPPVGHPDRAALRLIDLLLGNGATGLLDTALVHPHRVRGAGALELAMRGAGAQLVWARPREGQSAEEAEALLLEQVARLREEAVDPGLLQAIVDNQRVAVARRHEDIAPRAGRLVEAVAGGIPPAEADAWLAALPSVTPADIQRVARHWLGPDRVIVTRTRGEPAAAAAVPYRAGARRFADADVAGVVADVVGAPPPPPAPQVLVAGRDYADVPAPWGRTVHHAGPGNDLQHVVLRLDRGVGHAPTLAHLVHLWGRSGAGAGDRSAFEAACFALAGRVGASVNRYTSELVLDGMADRVRDLAALAAARLERPRLDRGDAAQALDETLSRRREARETRGARASALDRFVLRGEASEYRAGAPTDAAVRALVDVDLRDALAPLLDTARVALSSGPRGPEALAGDLSPLLGGTRPPPPLDPVRYLRPAGDRVLLAHHPGAQVRVAVFVTGPPQPHEIDPLRIILSEVIGGPASLLFQEIREARGLAYSVGGRCERGWRPVDDSVLWGVANVDPGRAGAVAGLLLALLRDGDAVAGRFDTAVAGLRARDRGHRVRPRAVPATVAGWHRAGFEGDPRPARRAAWSSASEADLRALHATWAARPATVTLLGDLDAVDRGALAAIGPVAELGTTDLFSY